MGKWEVGKWKVGNWEVGNWEVTVQPECSDLLHVVVTAVLRADRETPSYESLEALRGWLLA